MEDFRLYTVQTVEKNKLSANVMVQKNKMEANSEIDQIRKDMDSLELATAQSVYILIIDYLDNVTKAEE